MLQTSLMGDDFVDAGTGNDLVYGMAGADVIDGGAGDDDLSGDGTYSDAESLDYTPLALHGDDILYGGSGNDTLRGQGGNDYLDGEDDDGELSGGSGDDDLFGGNGNDLLHGDATNLEGDLHGHDYLDGEAGGEAGGGGNDCLHQCRRPDSGKHGDDQPTDRRVAGKARIRRSETSQSDGACF